MVSRPIQFTTQSGIIDQMFQPFTNDAVGREEFQELHTRFEIAQPDHNIRQYFGVQVGIKGSKTAPNQNVRRQTLTIR